jgi:hypothetical protein
MDRTPLHLVKLSVGSVSIADHADWQAARIAERRAAGLDPRYRHVTRMWPKRAAEIAGSGSLYWVIQGVIRFRQRIEGFEEVRREDGIRRCGIILDPGIVLVEPRPRAAFQGWRYLAAADAPRDLAGPHVREEEGLPPALLAHLAEMGVRAA